MQSINDRDQHFLNAPNLATKTYIQLVYLFFLKMIISMTGMCRMTYGAQILHLHLVLQCHRHQPLLIENKQPPTFTTDGNVQKENQKICFWVCAANSSTLNVFHPNTCTLLAVGYFNNHFFISSATDLQGSVYGRCKETFCKNIIIPRVDTYGGGSVL